MSLIADIHNDMEDGAIRLITEYRARLFSDAVRICGNPHDADDLVDRTFVKVLRTGVYPFFDLQNASHPDE